jgi:tetratricopeptide (TPR) repeat protein
MKTKMIIALICLISVYSYAQKDEIKAIEKALKSNDFAAARSATAAADAVVSNMDDKTKAKYYLIKAQAYYAGGEASDTDFKTAIESLKDLSELEKSSGYNKYAGEAAEIKDGLLRAVLSRASKAYEAKDYKGAAQKFNDLYRMSTQDTIYLYYAASAAVQGVDYDTSLKYYEELRELGYDGSEMRYYAINKETNEEELFGDALMRDTSIKSGQYISPRNEKTASKSAEIVKNIALIYVSQDKNDKALAYMKDAREENPDDMGLILSEANVHLKMGNKDKFKELMELATTKDPNNPELQFNLGVLAAEAGDPENAKKYYQNAINLNPRYSDAILNMAVLILDRESSIIEEMNGLGTSAADDKRYEELKAERSKLYNDAVPYLQRVLEIDAKNLPAAETLMNMYSALGETDKYKAMKAKVEEIKAGN